MGFLSIYWLSADHRITKNDLFLADSLADKEEVLKTEIVKNLFVEILLS